MQLFSVLSDAVQNNAFMAKVSGIAVEFKECARRMTSNCISNAYATVAALLHVEHPVALLRSGGSVAPLAGIEASAAAFVRAGKAVLEPRPNRDIIGSIRDAFRHQRSLAATGPEGGVVQSPLAWNASYLGILCCSNPCL